MFYNYIMRITLHFFMLACVALYDRAYLVTAIMKLVAQNGSCPPRANRLIEQYSNSSSLDVYQR
jgi:hypothetical protein